MLLVFILAIGLTATIDARTTPGACRVSINKDLPQPQPLYFGSNLTDFVSTVAGSSDFEFPTGSEIELFCSDGFKAPYKNDVLTATCVGDKQFNIDNKQTTLNAAACKNPVQHSTKATNRKCDVANIANIVEVGFQVKGNFVPTYEVCHESRTSSTKWVHYQLHPNNAYFQRSVERPFFTPGDFYPGLNIESLYSNFVQRKTIGRILGSEQIASDIVKPYETSDFYLARGHMVAKADFVLAPLQMSTFYYINVAPQWQTFNGGNWEQIEIGVRRVVAKRNIEAEVYTGTHGIFKYPDFKGIQREIYLAPKPGGQSRVPVPLYYFKVVISKETDAGIVFIGVNNPYMKPEVTKSHVLCPDVSDQVNYINWDRTNITAGYSYACSVDEFTKVVKSLPKLPTVTKLLL